MADFRFLAPLAVLVGLLLLAPAASASHVQCGDTITKDTTLDSDLLCAGDGLTIDGSVVVDFAGHTIEGTGRGTGVQGSFMFEVRGGTVRGFQQGVFGEGVSAEDMLFERNVGGMDCFQGGWCYVQDSTFRHNSGAALVLEAPDSYATGAVRRNHIYENGSGISIVDYNDLPVTDNRVERNDGRGISMDYHAEAEVLRNVVVGNHGDGIVMTYGAHITFRGNLVARNRGDGIEVSGGGDYGHTVADVDDNTIRRNGGDGVFVWGYHLDALIRGNRVDRNGDDGINVYLAEFRPGCCDITVQANRAFFNADLGIEVAPPAMDGGGNRAKHNGNPAQCVGVVCK